MTDNTAPEKRLIAIDAEAVEEVRLLELDIRTYANYLERHQQMPGLAAGIRREATALRNILAAWDEGITRDDVEAVIGPDMEYVTGGCSCARCNAQRALYTAVAGAPQEAEERTRKEAA